MNTITARPVRTLAVALLGLGLAFGATAHAGDEQRGKRGHDPVARMAQSLDLSVEQQQDIRLLMQSHREWVRGNLRDADGNWEPGAREAMRDARAALHDEIRLRLSPEQQARLDELRADRRGHYRGGRHGKRGKGHARRGMGAAYAQLDLSDAQRTEIRALMRNHREQMRSEYAARRDAGEAARPDREARRESWQSLRADIESVLTPEQLAELETAREARREAWRERRSERGERGERRYRDRG